LLKAVRNRPQPGKKTNSMKKHTSILSGIAAIALFAGGLFNGTLAQAQESSTTVVETTAVVVAEVAPAAEKPAGPAEPDEDYLKMARKYGTTFDFFSVGLYDAPRFRHA
jgi:hypothetical protein